MENTIDIPQQKPLTKKDFESDQLVRWCPGCGDYSILSAMTNALPQLNIPRENFCIRFGDWLRLTLSLLYEYVWLPYHSWAWTGSSHRCEAGKSETECLGNSRRWRCAGHWWQSFYSRAAQKH